MDKYLFSQVLALILAPALGYFLARWKMKDELSSMKEKAPYEALANALKARETTITQLVAAKTEDERADEEKDQKERIQLAQVLVQISGAMQAIKDELVEHRQEERERTASFHNRLNEIQKDIWATRGGNGGLPRA